ncbi:hypothetical protein ACUXAV_006600 [Cupriavidus metallidurans]|jgi:hypothetical protein|uniref:Uncharacterized protein n=3 Tax=Cupriavidus TaxID=106589 RepID=Q1LA78_CUPMC|nr:MULTISPECIES: hypothetical protein [Cupriavidus]ABF12948.1 Hypothetical protein Rmet_6089 [Cupriavidus metallidurans CH34]AZG12197.1 hypothetical protein EHF44_01655 [Cupriavidus pauculus]MDE4922491.1 hypothetical protein [Cupriavidus metallidurans]QBP14307.1 hypothetical protein DDF84_031710 [Cupriavidus metallidurans]QGS31242.1 hypothetical protein FOB83_20185 [Cupriavidus metallidurans]
MPTVPIHKEFRLLSSTPNLTWQKKTPPASGAHVNIWWLYLTMQRASKLGLTLGGSGQETVRATAEAALSVCAWDGHGYSVTPAYSRLKDYVKPFLSGTLGAGLALLQMDHAGYPWMAHWEDCGGQTTSAHPDFVFFRAATATTPAAVCLAESKGSRATTTDLDVQKDWERQVWSNRHQVLTLPGGGNVAPTEGTLVSSELPGPAGKKRFRSTLVHGVFPSGLPAVTPATASSPGGGVGPNAAGGNQPLDQHAPEMDWRGIQRASLRHTCRLLDMPLTESILASRFWDGFSLNLLFTQPRPSARRVVLELRDRRALLGWDDQSEPDVVYAGPPQVVVQPDGSWWGATIYCRASVLREVLRGRVVDVVDTTERRVRSWGEGGQQMIRLEAADGVGLMVRKMFGAPGS